MFKDQVKKIPPIKEVFFVIIKITMYYANCRVVLIVQATVPLAKLIPVTAAKFIRSSTITAATVPVTVPSSDT